jgi:hypothetical protein
MKPADPQAVSQRFRAIVARVDAECEGIRESAASAEERGKGRRFREALSPSQWFIEEPEALPAAPPLLGTYQDDDTQVRA